LSINPEHVENILNGTKKYEYRKIRCKRNVTKILIYSTHPVMMVVGEAAVTNVLEHRPDELWEMTSGSSGIGRDFFDDYFEGRDKAVAYELGEIIKYETERELSEFSLTAAPQSFAYIIDNE
jgi:predicted transcriptional regulator